MTVSIVIEWGNVLHANLQHALEMLRVVARQAADLLHERHDDLAPAARAFLRGITGPIDLLILYDDRQCSEDSMREAARACGEPLPPGLALRLVATPGCAYYAMKNHSVSLASGDLVVFMDSDVVPQEGWLAQLVSTFADETVGVAAGQTYLRTDRFYSRAFAAGWFFPPRSAATDIVPTDTYFANNLAIRRQLFARHPFPVLAGTTRGACGAQAALLARDGVKIVRNLGAHAVHPAPEPEYFFTRALAQGRDYATLNMLAARPEFAYLPRKSLLGRFAISCVRVAAMVRRARAVGMPAREVVPAMALMAVYYLAVICGEGATYLFPAWMQEHFRI